jgi:methylenetetrahydrofolate dehydrogenase (NADP+)/methenyltetrahydrofolate cyclohydrolase
MGSYIRGTDNVNDLVGLLFGYAILPPPLSKQMNKLMTAQLIDGKALATQLKAELSAIVREKLGEGKRRPGLAVILVGGDPASSIYVRKKRESCEEVGIQSYYHHLPEETQEQELLALIHELNHDEKIDGILLQLPLPRHINANKMLDQINPAKDVDGFHPYNFGCLAQRRPTLRPCTPFGIMMLMDSINQVYKGKHAVVVGASNIVGRPMALELLIAGATVTICHRFTDNLEYFVKQADILVSAVGKPNFIKGEWIKPGSTIIDVGITRLEDGSLSGDVEFEAAKEKAAWITPVPGGVGPMTVAVLLRNTLDAASYLSKNIHP